MATHNRAREETDAEDQGSRIPSTPGAEPPDTKSNLLDAAEVLFADLGVDGASLRAITTRAGVNVAAANYHFGSKEALLRAVVARRMRPVNEERLAALDAIEAEAKAGGTTPNLDAVVRAFVAPIILSCSAMPDGGKSFSRLAGRVLTGHDERLRAIVHEELAEIITRFVAAFAATLPHLDMGELVLRIHFMVGAMAHAVAGREMLGHIFGSHLDVDDLEAMTQRLIMFLTAGLAAPGATSPAGAVQYASKGTGGRAGLGSTDIADSSVADSGLASAGRKGN